MAVACLLSEGHLLIEDMPGMGKTTLAHALGKVFNLSYNHIQFTSDILPADIIGASVFDKENSQFVFHEGPIFNQLILADEINRTTPKSQSALLEAMEERQVTVDGDSRSLPGSFLCDCHPEPKPPGWYITALLLLLRRSQHKLGPADREYLKFCRYLANQGLARSMGEGPISYARRVVTFRPDLATSVDAVTDAYIRTNFIDDHPEDVDTLREAVRRVRHSELAGA